MINTYVALDLETTGLSPSKDRILEIGAALIVEGVVTRTYDQLINTGMPISLRIQQLTGITDEMQRTGKCIEEAIPEFLEFCGEYPILGHNICFDYSFLKQAVYNQGLSFEKQAIDTLRIARAVLPEAPSRKLPDLCAYFQIDPGNSHRALDDAISAHKLYQKLLQMKQMTENKPFEPQMMSYSVRKQSPITISQKGYLNDLLKYHKIETDICIENLTKSEASRMIDRLILEHGRIMRKKG